MHEYQRPKRKRSRPFRFYSDSSNSDKNDEESCDEIPSLLTLKTPTEKSNMSPRRLIITSCKPSTSTADCSSKRTRNIAISSPRLERAVSPPQNTSRTTLTSSEFYKSGKMLINFSVCTRLLQQH